jgi:hypothetical protein
VTNEITFTPTEAMLKTAYGLHYKALGKKRMIGYVIFGLIMGVVLAAVDGFSSVSQSLQIIGAVLLWALFVMLVIIIISRYWWIPRFVRRVFAQQKDLQQTATIRWTDTAYETEIASGKITTPWTEFFQWKRSEGMLLLYRSEVMFNFFPTVGEECSRAADAIQKHLMAAEVKEKK